MANTVQDQMKVDWKKAQTEGAQRAARIRKIVAAAASEALAEVKEGSTELQTISRQSLAELLEQLKQEEAKTAASQNGLAMAQVDASSTDAAGQQVPTWRQIFGDLWGIANARKGDWAKQVTGLVQQQLVRLDAEYLKLYGQRYGRLRSWVKSAYQRVTHTDPVDSSPAVPVKVEVLPEVGEAGQP